MTAWPPPLLLHPDHLPWCVDATAALATPDALRALPWAAAFRDLEATEAGDIANPDEGRQVGHFWLRAPERAPSVDVAAAIADTATAVREFAAAVRGGRVRTDADESFTDALLVGIGGSALGPALVVDALSRDAAGAARGLRLHVLDNTDPDGIHATLGGLGARLGRTLVVVISKSGSTPEPNNALALARRAMDAAGVTAPRHLVAITVDGSALHRTAVSEGWLATFPMWDFVGGRYSVTSAVGLLPAELAGVDTVALLDGAAAMDAWTRSDDPLTNPAALLAGVWHLAGGGRGDRALVILPYADRLVLLSRWLQQLVMESIGKSHDRQGRPVAQGLTVYGNKGSTDQHAYVQQLRDGRDDFLAVFVQVLGTEAPDPILPDGHRAGDHLQGFLLGTRRALAESGRRSITLTVPRVDAYAVGGLIALFERAVGLYASLIDVNAYHQPGVEAGKKAASALLDRGQRLRAALTAGPATAHQLARALDADPVETLYQLARLEQIGVAGHSAGALHGTWHLR